ncbi:hypothetical protein [Cupriavidus necator]
MEPSTSTVAGGTLLAKLVGWPIIIGAVTAALGMLVLWPKTMLEGFTRLVVTILSSSIIGPFFVFWLHGWKPELFASAKQIATEAGIDPLYGLLLVSAPLLVMSGLPAWWVLGAIVRWFDKRKGQDIGELIHDAKETIREVRQ